MNKENQERHHKKVFVSGLQFGQKLLGVQVGNLPLDRLNGLSLVDSPHMEVDNNAVYYLSTTVDTLYSA